MKNKTFKIVNYSCIAAVAAITVTVSVLMTTTFADLLQNNVFGSGITIDREEGEALATQIEEEGIVMVKNENNSLPLDVNEDEQVNVFGWSSTQWIGGGSGSGRVVSSMSDLNVTTGLLDALYDYGIDYNTELTEMYRNYLGERPNLSNGTLNTYDYQFHRLYEPDINDTAYYSDSLLENAKAYSDTAIVVIGRMCGESNDAPKVQYKGNSSGSSVSDPDRTYLEISTEEEALLEYVGANYENVVVVINSTNTMELGFMETIDGLDSCLVVGGSGINAANGIVNVLYGEASPSGRLTDTYAYEFETNPTYINAGADGENLYTDGSGYYPADGTTNGNVGNSSQLYDGVSYVDYCEDIYVGYRWYETADEEGYWDDVSNEWGTGYDGVVQYPFGYGLSYSEFSYRLADVNVSSGSTLEGDETIEVTVNVTNTGDVAAKEVVQLYYTAPYYEAQIEKSSINLAAFDKTSLLEPGETEQLVLSFDVRDMASYDSYDSNNDGFAGYTLDKGTYEVKLMNNSHDLLEMSSGSNTITYKINSNINYETDAVTGNEVSNKFTGDDAVDGVSLDGSDETAEIDYLTRYDFANSFPSELSAARAMSDGDKENNLYTSSDASAWIDESDEDITTGADSGLSIYDSSTGEVTELGLQLGADFDDEEWDALLNQMTISEMQELTLHGYCKTSAVSSIGKPQNTEADGPNQIGSFNRPTCGTGFPNATVLGQTWSTSLSYDFGLALGSEARQLGYSGWYGPGINTHRSAFGGRNYEYFSEDPVLAGNMATNSVKGAKNVGVYAYLKHIAVYDQESNRDGLYTWLTEQSFREIYLKPFQTAIQEGGAGGVMTSYNRIGAVWAGGSTALIQGILRDEWGFNGTVLTDYADHHAYMNQDHALRAGGDLFMDGWLSNGTYSLETSSNSYKQALRLACKHIIYTWLNTEYTAANYSAADDVESVSKGVVDESWKTWVYVADGIIGAALIVWGVLVALRKEKAPKEEQTASE